MIALLFSMILFQNDEMINLAKNNKVASLSTNYKNIPFGSIIPYILDKKGKPVIFISSMALHTKNIKADARCSIMMHKIDKENVFNTSRITFVGKIIKLEGDQDELKKAYLEKYKEAEDFIDFEDFSFYRLEADKIYYIGGFGDIQWIELSDYYEKFKNQ